MGLSVTNIFVGIVLFALMFSLMFSYYVDSLGTNGNLTIDERYTNLSNNLLNAQNDIANKTDEIRNVTESVGESTTGTIIGGFTGFAKGISLLTKSITTSTGVISDTAMATDSFVPQVVKNTAIILIISFIVLGLLRIIVGSGGEI